MGDRAPFAAGTFLRYALGTAALGWILASVEWGRSLRLLLAMPLPILAGVAVVSTIAFVPRAWMWSALLAHFEDPSFTDTLRADLVIKFVNSFFPSRISGQAVAPVTLRHFTGVRVADATSVVVANMALYALLYGALSLAGFLVLLPSLSPELAGVVGLSTMAYFGIVALMLAGGWRLDLVEAVVGHIAEPAGRLPLIGARLGGLLEGLAAIVGDSAEGFRAVVTDARAVVGFGLSFLFLIVVLNALRIYLLLVGFGHVPDRPLLLPLVVVAAYAVTVLPLTPGGVGVTEATSILVFTAFGYPAAVVVPVIFIDRILGAYLPALAGWYPATSIDFEQYLGVGS